MVVVARCAEVRQYAAIRRGQWYFLWNVVAFDVIDVERGEWPRPRVVFCYYSTRPTPESGINILLKTAPFPFVEGRVLAIAIQPQAETSQAVGLEWRSYVLPHGRPRPTLFDTQSEEGKRLYDRLWAAVRTFAESRGWPEATGGVHFEETDDAYVLEAVFGTGAESVRRALRVDRESFGVSELP